MEIGLILLPFIFFAFLKNKIVAFCVQSDHHRNYQGRLVPRGGGLFFLFAYSLAAIWIFALMPGETRVIVSLFLLITGWMLLGLLDDFWGNNENKGLKGHLGIFMRKGIITTGLIKIFCGLIISLAALLSFVPLSWLVLLSATIVALSANVVNLLDLRPGRALKIALLASLALIITSYGRETVIILAPLLSAVLFYLPYDLGERLMLGDNGSNLLGSVLGFAAVYRWPYRVQGAVLILLLIFQGLCEIYSVSEIIGRNRFLKFFDQLGR